MIIGEDSMVKIDYKKKLKECYAGVSAKEFTIVTVPSMNDEFSNDRWSGIPWDIARISRCNGDTVPCFLYFEVHDEKEGEGLCRNASRRTLVCR
jgi:hypothetical protein